MDRAMFYHPVTSIVEKTKTFVLYPIAVLQCNHKKRLIPVKVDKEGVKEVFH